MSVGIPKRNNTFKKKNRFGPVNFSYFFNFFQTKKFREGNMVDVQLSVLAGQDYDLESSNTASGFSQLR
jgi:hypothetical protein